VSGGHRHLHVPGTTLVHRLPPQVKLAGLLAFAVTVAITPRRAVGVFAVEAAVLLMVVAIARIPVATLLGRLAAVVPFVLFAFFIPFIADGTQTNVLGVSLSTDGLWSTWNILAKAILGTTASIVISATTPIPDMVHGLARLRVPTTIVAIIAFMFRYLDVIAEQLAQMRRSMTARCHDPRWLWQARPIAASAGTLFVRSYERGERVHQAMLARGFSGQMPVLAQRSATPVNWLAAFVPAVVACAALLAHRAMKI